MIGRAARQAVEIGQAGKVALAIEALDRDAFRRRPCRAVRPRRFMRSGLCQPMPAKSGIIARRRSDRLVDAHRLEPLAEHGAVVGDRTAACLEDVDRTLGFLRIERRADDLALAFPIILGALVAGGDDARLHLAGDQAVQDAAFGFDQPELVPCRFAERTRSALRRCPNRRSDRPRNRYGFPSPG